MLGYVKKSMITILRALIMYKPLYCFSLVALCPSLVGLAIGVRFLVYYWSGRGAGHIQSLILACTLLIMGFITFVIGMLADVIAANRKILEDVEYHTRKLDYDRFINNDEQG